jgi:anthranilate synthase/indole-3-glycerol phosphate synthase/phosphoribosylanthranilate isomerase
MRTGQPKQQQQSSGSSTRVLLVLVTLFSNVSSFVSQPRRPLVSYSSSSMAATRATTDASTTAPYTDTQLAQALESLLEGSTQPAHDARHIFGYGDATHELSMLQRITATRILDYRDNHEVAAVPLADWEARAAAFGEAHGGILNLQTVIQTLAPRMALAAEFKRASPSKGAIALDVVAGEQAQVYAAAGANIISILTESRWFEGSLADMQEARLATNDGSPAQRPAILRKDFVTSPIMIAEAAAHGADTILLIVAVTPQHLLEQLITYSRLLGMEPLVEVHANVELDVALQAGAKVIGVNNRNLHTFEMDLSTSERVAEQLTERGLTFAHGTTPSADYSLCALSGMSTAADVHRYRQAGLGMCLIGESLMRAADAGAAIRSLCLHPDDYEQQAASLAAGGAYTGGCQLIKVCGLTRPEDALVACRVGATLIGVIFAPKSKRCVTVEQAKAVVETVRTFGERRQRIDVAATSMASPLASLATSAQSLAQAARRPLVVGVFQNQEPAFVRQMVQECGLDLVQLHGSEGFAAANREACGVPAIRVVDIVVDPATGLAAENAVERILESLTSDPVAILLDTAIKGQSEGGGTSTTFDWSIAERLQAQGLPVLIAGGLTADTIGYCAGKTRPLGVDVSSGVEVSPGIKNPDQVTAFVQNAKQAAQEARKGF